MARALAFLRVTDADGDVQGSKAITFREEDDSTSFASNLYAARSGGAPITTLNTDAEGYAKIFTELADARPFNWRVAGDAAGVLDQFIPDPRDLVNLSTSQTITGAKQLNTPTLVTPIFSGTATGFQTASVLNAAGEIALRFLGTVDVTVPGTWTATNGSPTVTANSDQTATIRRDQAVKIGSEVFTVSSVVFSAGTTTLTLDSNYLGVTGTVTLLEDDDEAFAVKTGDSRLLFYVGTNGDISFGPFPGMPAGHFQDASDDATYGSGFLYDNVHRRLHLRSLLLTEIGDPVDLALRRAGGTYPDGTPTQTAATENLGAIFWSGYGGSGWNFRSAVLYARSTETITSLVAGGEFIIGTTPNGAQAPLDRWNVAQDGAFRAKNNADTNWLSVLFRDSGDNINIGRDDNINLIQLYGPVDYYASVASPGTALRVNSAAGILLPALDPPTANYATQRSINHVVGTVTWSAGTPSLAGDYNCASVTDAGTGDVNIVVDLDFANTNYAVVHSPHDASNRFNSHTLAKAVGSFRIQTTASGGDVLTDLSGAQNSLDFIASGVQ